MSGAVTLIGLGLSVGYLCSKQGSFLLSPDRLDSIDEDIRNDHEPDDHIPTSRIRNLKGLPNQGPGSGPLDHVNPDLSTTDITKITELAQQRRQHMSNGIIPAKNVKGRPDEHQLFDVSGVTFECRSNVHGWD